MVGLLGLPAVAVANPDTETDAAVETTLDPELLSRTLDALVDAGAPSVLAEVRDGEAVWTEASGVRDPWLKVPTKPTDLVRVASITKPMVTTVVLQLVENGQLSLSDTIQDRLPGLLPYEEAITVEHLLNHTSGLPEYFLDIYPSLWNGDPADIEWGHWKYYSAEKLVAQATQHELYFAPGEQWSYTNTGYVVLGLLIEDITGNTLESELTERVLGPAEMTRTQLPTWNPFIMGPHPRAQLPTGYGDGSYFDTTEFNPSQLWAAGHAVSTPGDINKLFAALSDGTLLSEESVMNMRTLTPQSGNAYGLGLQAIPVGGCDDFPEGIAYGHTGGSFGATSFSFHSPDGDRQVTFTVMADFQFAPTDEIATAMANFTNAAMCDVDTTGATTFSAGPDIDTVMLDQWGTRD
ncbi:D-alanyl-D-alanine carboxypeptidase [Stackebrandtia endophytica]|uniref:D-alanyl-D-alanine carboxypeptidase n=2 Tax=Stackebrandtia endophytica TaxID=1496996 RepID=A0A543AX42_9ACTN|nr:D-alanyl-D-alanine carboxypeptidase [Stackebrandtia endophytica]